MIKSKYEIQIPRMIELRKSGLLLREISKEMNIPIETIRNLLHKHNGWSDIPDKQNKQFDFSGIDPLWMAEFRGFFFGEGCIMFRYSRVINNSGNYNHRPHLTPLIEIALRIDDRLIVEDIHKTFGGCIGYRKGSGNRGDAIRWSFVGYSRVYCLIPYLLDNKFPSKKIAELQLVKEACEVRFTMQRKMSSEQYGVMYSYYQKLRDLKLLKS